MPLPPRELMQLHVESLFTHDAQGCLLRVNEPDGAIAPRFFIGRTTDGPVMRFRADVDALVRGELERLGVREPLGPRAVDESIIPHPYQAILAPSAPVEKTWLGPAFAFPEVLDSTGATVRVTASNADCLHPLLSAWSADVAPCQPMIALLIDNRAVAVCCSVRRTGEAHEGGVETALAARGRGYAGQVAAAWARAVREQGVVPLYSTSWQNAASRSVARKLGLVPFGSDLHIT